MQLLCRFIFCESNEAYLSLESDDPTVNADEEWQIKRCNWLRQVDFHKYVSVEDIQFCHIFM